MKPTATIQKIPYKLLACISFLLFSACATDVYEPVKLSETGNAERLLILPFKNMSVIYGESDSLKSPLSGQIYLTGKVQEGATAFLAKNLEALIKSHTDFTVLPKKDMNNFLYNPASGDEKIKSERLYVLEAGRWANADVVLAGYLYRFKQRVGTALAVETPASVAFGIHLLNVSDGRILWSGHIDETQQSLSDNLLEIGSFVKRGGKWITSEEMAVSGLEELIKTFPKP
ncbi:MAG: hypothetical protein JJV89_02860 [Desulfosarcina sp.]|nr:hypothetical protein [Desulfobacterales bacterium]